MFCTAILAAFGLIYRVPVVGSALAGVLFVIPLSLGLLMTLVAGELAVGWSLLHAAVAAGAEDALDAVSRSFGYLNQRIGSIVTLVWFRVATGHAGHILVEILAGGMVRLTEWGLGLTGPAAQMAAVFGGAGGLSRLSAQAPMRSG